MNRRENIEEIIKSFSVIKRKMVSEHIAPPFKLSITFAQGRILHIVEKSPGIGIKEIAETMKISSSAATQLVESLINLGYLTKKSDQNDHRALQIELSSEKKLEIKKMKAKLLDRTSLVFNGLDDKELEQFAKLSKKIRNKLEAD